jgi:hypothetical protein
MFSNVFKVFIAAFVVWKIVSPKMSWTLRFYLLGLKKPTLSKDAIRQTICDILDELEEGSEPMLNWMLFCKAKFEVDWSRVNELPDFTELSKMKRCGCSVDPSSLCELHPCQCGCIKQASKKGADNGENILLACRWRQLHMSHLAKLDNFSLDSQTGRLTYCEVLEMQGKRAPTSARERNLLNIMAFQSQPLSGSYAVLDRTQSINRTGFRADGLLPTFCKSSRFWAMGLGMDIPVEWMAAIFGHSGRSNFEGLSASAVMSLLGNSMHVADVGAIMACGVLLKGGIIDGGAWQ